jgi:hypothetical protein
MLLISGCLRRKFSLIRATAGLPPGVAFVLGKNHPLKTGGSVPDTYRLRCEQRQRKQQKEGRMTKRRYMPRFPPSTQFTLLHSLEVADTSRDGSPLSLAGLEQRNFALSVFLQDGYNLNRFVAGTMEISSTRKATAPELCRHICMILRFETPGFVPQIKERFSWPKT